jgi:phosphoribosylaminoimidazole-succinocarboxamide synthase
VSGVLLESPLPNPSHRGKVRDTYDLGDRLLMVATDRISAFDVVLPEGIPDKGRVLTQLSAFWFDQTAAVVPNHMLRVVEEARVEGVPFELPPELWGRSMLVRKAERVNAECIVRGYLAGSAWAEYQASGMVSGVPLPRNLPEACQLPEPIFTPSTKAPEGQHDENITYEQFEALVGEEVANVVRVRSLAVYGFAAAYAEERGIIIADTKMEFGILDGEVIVIDELLTPDSSRFWPAEGYRPGRAQPSFDKQGVRNWLSASGWNKRPPPPHLPPNLVEATAARYREVFARLTGEELRTGA